MQGLSVQGLGHRFLLPLALLLAAALAACGPLPRPFQEEDKEALDLRAPSARTMLRVEAPAGAPPGDPVRFALLLAERLLEAGVAAEPAWFSDSAAPAGGARRLLGEASLVPAAGGASERLALTWRLQGAEGEESYLASAEAALEPRSWSAGETEALDDVARVSAAVIARALGVGPMAGAVEAPPPPAERGSETVPPTAGPRLVVLPVEGAPGDGADGLERAISQALRARGVVLGGLPGEEDLLLWCLVEVSPPRGMSQMVRIRWRVELAADFSELGTITQENQVPAGSLDRAWRETAPLVAEAAADGILELLRQAGLRPGS